MKLSLEEVRALIIKVFVSHNTSEFNAALVADALVAAEADGLRSHGLSRVVSYAEQARSGKVNGHVKPILTQVGSAALRVDAQSGFAYPAIELALEALPGLVKESGVAVATIGNSHHCGVLGIVVEKLARQGLVALMFSNSPQAIAPWGGCEATFGTNPIAFAAPRMDAEPLVMDLSLSKVARGKIKLAAEKGEAIPEGWALDSEGQPTTDAQAAMQGTMLPMGDAKGATLVMMVEILTAALSASQFGYEASSFFDAEGAPPHVGQTILAIDPQPLSANHFARRIESLITHVLDQPGTRLPGARRLQIREQIRDQGIELDQKAYDQLLRLAG